MRPLPRLPTVNSLPAIPRNAKLAIAAGLCALFAFVIARRLAGAYSNPLSVGGYLLMGLVLAGSSWLLRDHLSGLLRYWTAFAIAAGIVTACAAAISLQGASALGLLALWLPIVGELGWAVGRRQQSTLPQPPSLAQPLSDNAEGEVIALDSALAEMAFADPAVTQQLVRRREADGSETISGCLRANFAAGERTTFLHVPFCPPLAGTPSCSVETIDGAEARVKVSQVLRQGARLEVRLDQVASEPTEVVVEFSTA